MHVLANYTMYIIDTYAGVYSCTLYSEPLTSGVSHIAEV